jgi:hypothetical protein
MNRDDILKMTPRQIAVAYFEVEYAGTSAMNMIDEVVDELTGEELDAIVGSVYDQPHLLER